jgi:hypothetical protein
MKTQQEVNNFFQENTVHVSAIYQIVQYLKDLNLKLPNNVILHEKGIGQAYFFKWFDNKANSLNKIEYPKTFTQCQEILSFKETFAVVRNVSFRYYFLLGKLDQLLICRDAYWKIVGEQMGLDGPWEPDWKHINRKFYCIYNSKNNIVKNVTYGENKILAFPTEEMRDAFYENFKDLIESCKELL